MNVFKAFEKNVSELFGDTDGAIQPPISFKKLAKSAVAKMEKSVIKVDSTPVAPVLYTVLISSSDDSIMRPMYSTLCEETAAFLKKKAREKGYYLSGKPLVRFMVDPGMKKGKFAIFAETVDTHKLDLLRAEEDAFLNNSSVLGGAAQPEPRMSIPEISANKYTDDEAGLGFIPEEIPVPKRSSMTPAPLVGSIATSLPLVTSMKAPEEEIVTPPTQRRPFVANQVPSKSLTSSDSKPVCMLIDRKSGRTYTAHESTVIGRERQGDNIVLNDTNVSRRHAMISQKGQRWYIEDLDSTNGTQLNDVDIDVSPIRTGDMITIGITTLEVRIG